MTIENTNCTPGVVSGQSIDRFGQMVLSLLGRPASPLAAAPGTVFRSEDYLRPSVREAAIDAAIWLELTEEFRAWAR